MLPAFTAEENETSPRNNPHLKSEGSQKIISGVRQLPLSVLLSPRIRSDKWPSFLSLAAG